MGGNTLSTKSHSRVLNSRKSGTLHPNSHPVNLTIAATNVIGTPTGIIWSRRCGNCAVLLNNRGRPLIWKAVIAGRESSCRTCYFLPCRTRVIFFISA